MAGKSRVLALVAALTLVLSAIAASSATAQDEVVRAACADAGVEPVADVPPGVEACRRSGDGRSYLFLLNHGESPVEVTLPAEGETLLGSAEGARVRLGPFGVTVVREH